MGNQTWELELHWNSGENSLGTFFTRPKELNTSFAHSLVISIFDEKSQQIYEESELYSGPITYCSARHKLPNSIVENPNDKTVETTLKVLVDVDPINIEHLQKRLLPPQFVLCRSVTDEKIFEKTLSWNMEKVLSVNKTLTFSIAQDNWRVYAGRHDLKELSTILYHESEPRSTCLQQVIIDVLDEQSQVLYHQTSVWSGKIMYSYLKHSLPDDVKQNLSGKKLEITVIYVVHF